jgi:hypothetical protein
MNAAIRFRSVDMIGPAPTRHNLLCCHAHDRIAIGSLRQHGLLGDVGYCAEATAVKAIKAAKEAIADFIFGFLSGGFEEAGKSPRLIFGGAAANRHGAITVKSANPR